jgi:hypothetical protein
MLHVRRYGRFLEVQRITPHPITLSPAMVRMFIKPEVPAVFAPKHESVEYLYPIGGEYVDDLRHVRKPAQVRGGTRYQASRDAALMALTQKA